MVHSAVIERKETKEEKVNYLINNSRTKISSIFCGTLNLPIFCTKSSITVKSVDDLYIVVGQGKVENVDIVYDSSVRNRFWNHNISSLYLIAEKDLSSSFFVRFRNRKNLGLLNQLRFTLIKICN